MTIENMVAIYIFLVIVVVASEIPPVVRLWDTIVARLAAQLRAAVLPGTRSDDAFKARVEWATGAKFDKVNVIFADLEDLAEVVTFAVKDSYGDQTLIDFGAECGDTRFAIVKPDLS